MFRTLDEATAYVAQNLIQRAVFTADFKESPLYDDDHSPLPLGVLTKLHWTCPHRPMTEKEIRSSNTPFLKEWLASPPKIPDYAAAESQGIQFIQTPLTFVSITRCSRFLGYVKRSGRLNDKTQDVAALNHHFTNLLALTAQN
jgi:hypothetical protein